MNEKVYSYMRFSTPEQKDGHSLARQTDYARQYAEQHNLSLDDTLSMRDEGLSAYHQKHIQKGALGVFFRAIEEGMVQPGSILIVENLDRLSRANITEALPRFMDIINSNITLVTANNGREFSKQSIDSSPFTLFESLIEMVRANQESQHKSDRVKDAIVAQIKHWQQHGSGKIIRNGRDPLWVQPNEDKTGFDLIPERADVVRLIIDKFMKGWGSSKTCNYLNEHHPTFNRNRKWYIPYVGKIVRSSTLSGVKTLTVRSTQYTISNYYPEILSASEFEELQIAINRRAPTKGQKKNPGIITGLRVAYCGHCGESIIAQNHNARSYKQKKYKVTSGLRRLRCNSESSKKSCDISRPVEKKGLRSIPTAPIEHALLDYCADQMELGAILNDDTDQTLELKARLSSLQAEADKYEQGITSTENSIEAFVMNGGDLEELTNILKRMRGKLQAKKADIDKLETELRYLKRHKSSDVIEQWQAVKGKVHSMDEDARLLIRQIVKKTFKNIRIFFHSYNRSETGQTLPLEVKDDDIVMILTFHNDKTRILVIDRKSGDWVKISNQLIN